MQPRWGPQIGICNGVQKSLETMGSMPQGHTCPRMLAAVANCGRRRKWGCRGSWHWDLNPGVAAVRHLFLGPLVFSGTTQLWHRVRTNAALGCSLLPRGLGSRRDFAWKRRGKRTLAGGPWEGAAWLWITGDCGGDTADGARSLNHRLLLLFLRYCTPDWAEAEGRAVCVCGYSKEL